MSVIFKRRSLRTFLPTPIEQEKLIRIVSAGFEAPSARFRRPWEFMIITDSGNINAISKMDADPKWCGAWSLNAKAVIAVLLNADKKMTLEFDPDDAYWIQDLSAATQNILLQAVEEGLGGCWLGWYPNKIRVEAFSKFFNLPENIIPFSLVGLGYTEKPAQINSHFKSERVYFEKYGNNISEEKLNGEDDI